MTRWFVLDTNLLLLLLVGRAREFLVERHKRLRDDYTVSDFRRLSDLIQLGSGIVVVPQVLAEVSNLARQIGGPAHRDIMLALQKLIADVDEVWVPSAPVAPGEEFIEFGLTDAVLLWLMTKPVDGRSLCLLTADHGLANRASSLGHPVLNYHEL